MIKDIDDVKVEEVNASEKKEEGKISSWGELAKPKDKPAVKPQPKEVKTVDASKTSAVVKDNGDNESEAGSEQYIVIDGKKFWEIQIEGEAEEYLMDDEGNIYDGDGKYIGTAKEGEDEEDDN